eukprot:7787994-Pyramimonas_sp.AAC.1
MAAALICKLNSRAFQNLEATWGPLGIISGPSWGLLGLFLGALPRSSQGLLGAYLSSLGAFLGPYWGPFGRYWSPLGAL